MFRFFVLHTSKLILNPLGTLYTVLLIANAAYTFVNPHNQPYVYRSLLLKRTDNQYRKAYNKQY